MEDPEVTYEHIGGLVFAWARSIVHYEDSAEEVTQEMTRWINGSGNRLWGLAVSAVGCLKDMMQSAMSTQTGLLVAKEGSWFIKNMEVVGGDPNAVAAIQTAIAMCNRDADMAHDIMIAHERVGGPPALFGVALSATSAVAGMLEDGAWVGTSEGGVSGLWKP